MQLKSNYKVLLILLYLLQRNLNIMNPGRSQSSLICCESNEVLKLLLIHTVNWRNEVGSCLNTMNRFDRCSDENSLCRYEPTEEVFIPNSG